MTRNTIIHAQLEVSHCTAELSLNEIPLAKITWSPTRIPFDSVASDHLIVPGVNTLELLVEPGETPAAARSEAREMAFTPMLARARLIRFVEGAAGLPEDGTILCDVEFRRTSEPPRLQRFPQSLSGAVDMGAAQGRWAWQDAPILVLNDSLRCEARGVLDELERAICSLDSDFFWRLTEHQLRDVMRAYPAITEPYLRADLANRFARLRDVRDPVVKREPAAESFRLVAGGRLLHCIDRDWTPTFKLREAGSNVPIPYSIFLARIGQSLRIVR